MVDGKILKDKDLEYRGLAFGDFELAPPPLGGHGKRRTDLPPERKYSFETPPDPIPENKIQEVITSEVVIVGGGISGMCAALSAAEAGAKVAQLEQTGTFQSRNGHNGFINSRVQKRLGIEIDKEEVIMNLMKYAANKPDQRLIRIWAEKSGEVADWLLDMTDEAGYDVVISGYPFPPGFDNSDEYYPTYPVTHKFLSPDVEPFHEESLVVRCLMENAVKKGVDIHYHTRARQLIRKGSGRVTCVIAQTIEGYKQFNATKAVVLCTGDYSNDSEMMAKYSPHVAYLGAKVPTSNGDGHKMAMWIGAVMEPMPHAAIYHGFAGPLGSAAYLQVNIKGERFQNEDVSAQSYTNAIERQPNQQAWQIFDSKYPDEILRMGAGFASHREVSDDLRKYIVKEAKHADTIEELAMKMGAPVEAFKGTVDRYNELAHMGKDLDFGKRPDRLTTIDKPPYYACLGTYELLVVLGGLIANPKLQPLDKDWEVIPGLYVAGNVLGNRFGVDYPLMCPGISHGMALVFGRIAGLNAATLE